MIKLLRKISLIKLGLQKNPELLLIENMLNRILVNYVLGKAAHAIK